MRKFNAITLLIIAMLVSSTVMAQDILVVDPGSGTLNAAIEANGGDKIYQLQAGQWYGIDKIIENVDFHLQIIGEDYDDTTMPATLQTGTLGDGAPFGQMFDAKGDITLKNVYFVNADLNGQIPARWLIQSDSSSFVKIDNCIIDPMGQFSVVEMPGGANDLYFTNNIALRHGNELGANDGHCFVIDAADAASGCDTAYFENNTFVSIGMNWLSANFTAHVTNFLYINHNTFIQSKSQVDWSLFENEYYMTNNLFFDFMTGPYAYHWQPMPGGDVAMPKPMLIYADTIPDEVLPSTRIQYVQYNNMYHSQGAYDLVAEMNDTAAATGINKVNLHPLIWDGLTDPQFGADPAEAFAASREGHLFNHANNVNTDFPMWNYGNTTYDLDPGWTDAAIYTASDNFIAWARPANFIHAQGQSADLWPPPSEWPSWHWDPDGDAAINDTWPVFDGTYSDATTMRGSVASLPLGDLNWFPEKMAVWELNKEAIFDHMKAGVTEKFVITGVAQFVNDAASLSKIYPNPMSATAMIEFTLDTPSNVEIAVYNAVGQQVRNVMDEFRTAGTHTVTFERGELNHGLYFYTIKAGNVSETQKLMIVE